MNGFQIKVPTSIVQGKVSQRQELLNHPSESDNEEKELKKLIELTRKR